SLRWILLMTRTSLQRCDDFHGWLLPHSITRIICPRVWPSAPAAWCHGPLPYRGWKGTHQQPVASSGCRPMSSRLVLLEWRRRNRQQSDTFPCLGRWRQRWRPRLALAQLRRLVSRLSWFPLLFGLSRRRPQVVERLATHAKAARQQLDRLPSRLAGAEFKQGY